MKQYKIQIRRNSLFPWLYSPLYDQKVWIMYITREQNAHIWKFNSLQVFIALISREYIFLMFCCIVCFLGGINDGWLPASHYWGRPPDIDTSSAMVSSSPAYILRYHLYSGCVTKPRAQHWYCWLLGCERRTQTSSDTDLLMHLTCSPAWQVPATWFRCNNKFRHKSEREELAPACSSDHYISWGREV